MKYFLTVAILALATLFALTACEKEDYNSYPPTWQGFDVPKTIYPGQKISVTARQREKGHLINATDYAWSFTVIVEENGKTETVTYEKSEHTNYDGTSNADPQTTFEVPLNAVPNTTATISFAASYKYSGAGIQVSDGGNYDRPAGLSGSIISTSSSLEGAAKGTVRVQVGMLYPDM